MSNHKATKDSLDLRDTTMFRIWGEFPDQETRTSCKEDLPILASSRPFSNMTYRKYDEKDILNNPLPTPRSNPQRTSPRLPIMTFRQLRMSPTTKALIKIEPAISINISTISRLQIAQPIACDINERSNTTAQYARSDEDNPHLTRIGELFDVS